MLNLALGTWGRRCGRASDLTWPGSTDGLSKILECQASYMYERLLGALWRELCRVTALCPPGLSFHSAPHAGRTLCPAAIVRELGDAPGLATGQESLLWTRLCSPWHPGQARRGPLPPPGLLMSRLEERAVWTLSEPFLWWTESPGCLGPWAAQVMCRGCTCPPPGPGLWLR